MVLISSSRGLKNICKREVHGNISLFHMIKLHQTIENIFFDRFTGSSLGNTLAEMQGKATYKRPKWSDPSPDPAQAVATCTGVSII